MRDEDGVERATQVGAVGEELLQVVDQCLFMRAILRPRVHEHRSAREFQQGAVRLSHVY